MAKIEYSSVTGYPEFEVGRAKFLVSENFEDLVYQYLPYINQARSILESKGFGDLWYGEIFLVSNFNHMPDDLEREWAKYGWDRKNQETAGGYYIPGKDIITVATDPRPYVVGTIIHEMGHRYWYTKFDANQRDRFTDLVKLPTKTVVPPLPDIKAKALHDLEDLRGSLLSILGKFKASKIQFYKKILDAFKTPIFDAGYKLKLEVLDAIQEAWTGVYDRDELKSEFDQVDQAATLLFRFLSDVSYTLDTKVLDYVESKNGNVGYPELRAVFKKYQGEWLKEALHLLSVVTKLSLAFIDKAAGVRLKKYQDLYDQEVKSQEGKSVLPVSDYGGKNISEAFAEVFTYYLLGRDMTRDQVDSFKAVLGKSASERVADRYLTAGMGDNIQLLDDLLSKFKTLLYSVEEPWRLGVGVDKDAQARLLAEAAKNLLDGFQFSFDDTERQKALEKSAPFKKLENFKKLVKPYTTVKTWEDALAVHKSQMTKSKTTADKIREYSMLARQILEYFDSDIVTTIRILNYTVSLVNVRGGVWDSDKVTRLTEILTRTNRLYDSVGFGDSTGGRVFAFATDHLTGAVSHSRALATYTYTKDLIRLAVGGDSLTEVVHSLVHELGHRVYFKSLGSQAREAWKTFFSANTAAPDIDGLLRDWDTWAQEQMSSPYNYQREGARYLDFYRDHLRESGDKEAAMWWSLISWKIKDKLTPGLDARGHAKKGVPNDYEQIKAMKGDIKVFLHPVTAYSGTSAEELFAEVVAQWLNYGAATVPEIVQDIFRRVVPSMRVASRYQVNSGH